MLEVDAVPREGESVLGRGFAEPEDGGKATNQAVAAAKLGAPVRLVTLLGDDERGDRWREILAGYGMDTTFVMQQPGPTDVGFVLLPPSRIPAIASSIGLSVALEAALIERGRRALDDASLVICQLEAPQGCALASFRLARAAGARTLLNPAPAAATGAGAAGADRRADPQRARSGRARRARGRARGARASCCASSAAAQR